LSCKEPQDKVLSQHLTAKQSDTVEPSVRTVTHQTTHPTFSPILVSSLTHI